MVRSFMATLAIAAALVCATPVAAQHADHADRSGWTAADEDRSTILRFLERDEVSAAAERMGHDPQELGRAVLDLNDADAARVASEIGRAEPALTADTIAFSTTTLIIILLVVIILVLVAD